MFHNRRQLIGSIRHPIVTPAGYQGIGNINTALAYWGLRAYSAASLLAGTNAVQLNTFDGTQAGFAPKAANAGFVDPVDVENFRLAHLPSAGVRLHDMFSQVGGANLSSNTNDATSPTWNGTGLSSTKGSIDFASASSQTADATSATSTFTQAQPFTVAAVAKHTTANVGTLFQGGSPGFAVQFRQSVANQASIYSGTASLNATANDGTFNSIIGIFNGASSQLIVNNGTPVTGPTIGTSGITIGDRWGLGSYTPSLQFFDGSFCEIAIFAGALSAGTITAIYNNQRLAYGNIF